MKEPEVLDDLARARSNIASVEVRLAIRNLVPPDMLQMEEKVADCLFALARVQEQMRNWRRSKERRV
jgi:hypothetical protein